MASFEVDRDNVHIVFDRINEYFSVGARKPFFDPTTRKWDLEEGLKFFGNGLTGEAGEVSDEIKKMMRGSYDPEGPENPEFLSKLKYEIADVAIYLRHLTQLLAEATGIYEDETDFMISKAKVCIERWPEIFEGWDGLPF